MSSDNYLVISSDQCLSVVLRQLCVDLVPSDGAVKTLFFFFFAVNFYIKNA